MDNPSLCMVVGWEGEEYFSLSPELPKNDQFQYQIINA
jgi:hypothetical protein